MIESEVPPLRITRSRRPAHIRVLFSTLYLLATLLAGLAHVRDCCAVVEAQAGCDDPGAHWASHRQAPEVSAEHDHDCWLCQSRAPHQPWALASPEPPAILGRLEHEGAPAPRPLLGLAAHRTRGPPVLG